MCTFRSNLASKKHARDRDKNALVLTPDGYIGVLPEELGVTGTERLVGQRSST